ncbi:protein-methionine-sulfoxide reductase catalytic subunit MsrP [Silvibacterium dinghuense]|uniref:Protein-methionine-sulfoxide reductase catalytic subunit MsrP n=1 Tax=Silvibacterium dinghuense TaxID=1560006 RepID=A0A4Q1SI06_9BACT|nr:protein-methionine-sulfoxide reductase catalytic subunit MsrP [Silvibacterium dinghuense]RXS96993.1 protein-methionine-sulfoxide reductase catalytic subunit MsrP [Silvibacterium dinghuense]GGG95312.1 protein-methionine-sulfoxide reductase catalytic subunit MsrP [Silvibacterium dinghuense]
MWIRKASEIPSSEITPKSSWLNRRAFMAAAGAAGLAAVAGKDLERLAHPDGVHADTKLSTVSSPLSGRGLTETAYNDITHYNNFYEFGTDKGDPSRNAWRLKTRPWTVSVEGLVKTKKTFDIDSLMKLRPLEDRIYRFRCVEAWSMVIPWVGYSLSEFIQQCDPLPSAKYVQFLSLADPKQMPGLGESSIQWPYSEGLRMDEAMHPLTLFTFGLYGETLPNQDGAPVRIVVPWKYGFKSAKSIVKVRFLDKQPRTTWNDLAPDEYGFYSNVNPNVDHPRWSQKTERVIGASLFHQRQSTLMFNGYEDQVAGLYKGMDLRRNY